MWYVYVLKSQKNDRLYTGYTRDLERRILEHNNGKSKYTRLTRPFVLVYQEQYENRIDAIRRENFLKSGSGREFLKGLGLPTEVSCW